MSDILNTVLEKFKKVEGGILDPQRSGADGAEDNFIGKHIDNVQATDGPGVEKEKGHPHNAGEKVKMADRKKDRKGYEPKEDAEVYESSDEGYDIEDFYVAEEDDLDVEFDMETLKEDSLYFMNIFEEAVAEFIEEEADEEEKEMLEEMMSTDEGMMELIDSLFEEKECGECGKAIENCKCDDHDHEGTSDDDVIDAKPRLKKTDKETTKEGYGKKKSMKEGEEEDGGATVNTKRADVKMIKTRTPDGRVIFRKDRKDIKVN